MATVPPAPDSSAADNSALPQGSEVMPGLSGDPDPTAADVGGSQVARTRATESVIDRFGGIRPMAGKLDIPVTTVQGWKKRGHIPATRRPDIVAAAASHALVLDAVELDIALADLPGDDALPDPIVDPIIDPIAEPIADPPPLVEDDADRAVPASVDGDGDMTPGSGAAAATPTDPPAAPVADPVAEPVAAPVAESAPAASTGTDKRKADRPARPSAPPEPQPKRRGGGFAFLAFLLSTVTAAAVVTDILRPGLLGSVAAGLPGIGTVMAPPPPDPAVQAVSDRVAQLETGVASLSERPALPTDLTALPDRFRTLETELYAIADRLGGLNGRLAVLEAGAGAPGGIDEATLRQELDATRTTLREELTQLLETRLGAVERAEPQTLAAAPVDSAAGIDLTPLADRLDRVEAMVTALSDRLDGLTGQVATLETAKSTSTVTGDVTGGAPALAGEALVVAANQLLGALRGGLPYADELAAVAALGTGDGELAAALEPLGARAEAGLPTAAVLIAGFRGLPDAIIRAERTRPDAGWLNQTLGRVAALVTVRRTDGDAAGGAVEAVVARAEAAVRRGDLAAAVTELETLEGPAAEAAAGWLADARALVAAETAAQAVSRLAVARLAAGGGAP